MVEQYIRKLRGVISVTENAGEDGTQAEAWAILEEIFAGRLRRDQRLLRPRGAVQRDRGADHDRAGRGPWQPERRGNRPDHRPPAEGRYSFGGENARRADLDALDRAKEMERQGVAMETIFPGDRVVYRGGRQMAVRDR